MTYWLFVASEENFLQSIKSELWGTNDSLLPKIKNAKVGDKIYYHIVGMKAGGIFVVTRGFLRDNLKIWKNGIYPNRICIRPLILPKNHLDITEFFHRNFKVDARGYFWKSMRSIPENEFKLFEELISNINHNSQIRSSEAILILNKGSPISRTKSIKETSFYPYILKMLNDSPFPLTRQMIVLNIFDRMKNRLSQSDFEPVKSGLPRWETRVR